MGAPLLTIGVVENRAAIVVLGVRVAREEQRVEAMGREEALAIPADRTLTVRAAVLQMLRLRKDIDCGKGRRGGLRGLQHKLLERMALCLKMKL